MSPKEKHELTLLGFTENDIKEIEKAKKVAIQDMKPTNKNNNAEKNRTDS